MRQTIYLVPILFSWVRLSFHTCKVCEFIDQGTVSQNNEICNRHTALIWVSKNVFWYWWLEMDVWKFPFLLFHVVTVAYDGGSHFYFENILSSLQCDYSYDVILIELWSSSYVVLTLKCALMLTSAIRKYLIFHVLSLFER